MNVKKILLMSLLCLLVEVGYSQCSMYVVGSFSSNHACQNETITVSGGAGVNLCITSVSVQLEKYNGSTWTAIGSPVIASGSVPVFGPISITYSNGSGNYRLRATKSNTDCGCGSATAIYPDPTMYPNGYAITFYTNPTADAGLDQTICVGDCATVGIGGRTPANTTYVWNPSGSPASNPKQAIVCPTSTTTYTLTVTDQTTGCTATDQVTITVVSGGPCDNDLLLPDPNGGGLNHVQKNGELETRNEMQMSVYPNPSAGKFIIQLDRENAGTIEVYNILGTQVLSMKKEIGNIRYEIDLTGYPAGIYTVRMVSNGKLINYKLILQ